MKEVKQRGMDETTYVT